jgi:hypothetical protein
MHLPPITPVGYAIGLNPSKPYRMQPLLLFIIVRPLRLEAILMLMYIQSTRNVTEFWKEQKTALHLPTERSSLSSD